ncbi:hypothetical protein RA2_02504 [Roseovarius sp. A-2]|nr:hypothetical protein RA2_02504 [Roseovarius sp. A-2]
MNEVTIIGIDLAKTAFHLHGATASGEPVFRKKLSRAQVLKFLEASPPASLHWKLALRRTIGVVRFQNWAMRYA